MSNMVFDKHTLPNITGIEVRTLDNNAVLTIQYHLLMDGHEATAHGRLGDNVYSASMWLPVNYTDGDDITNEITELQSTLDELINGTN